jgi:hypothetical protein
MRRLPARVTAESGQRLSWAAPIPEKEGSKMAQTLSRAATAEYRAVIYLCGTEGNALDDAERRCRDYAARFGWHVAGSVRRPGNPEGARPLLSEAQARDAQIIMTDTLDMISPDQAARDELLTDLERARCILQPVTPPVHPAVPGSAQAAR